MPSKLVNTFPTLIMRSPFHAIVSSKYTIIEFTGRKSGRVYRTPVAYLQDGDHVLLSTDSRWYRPLGCSTRLSPRQTIALSSTSG